tara:strand:+ start:198 stop:1586 length:1389 start_codon:yes stop_codon:yes gene_type:complete
MEKGNKRIIRGWTFYDWANSVYNLVISSAIFPLFFAGVTTAVYRTDNNILLSESVRPEDVTSFFFGMEINSSVLYSYVLSVSFLVVAFLSPLLSGIADYSGKKKMFLRIFCYMGALSCFGLYFFDANHMELSMIPFFLASVGFWGSLVFYNSFLPEIAEPKDQDKISAKGYILGYVGSMICLLLCLYWKMGLEYDIRYCFVFVGIWWLAFSHITYAVLPNNVYNRKKEKGIIWKGFKELKIVYKEFNQTVRLKRYLTSFFFFNTGVQTVMLMATLYASRIIFKIPDELRATLSPEEITTKEGQATTGLIVSILLIQILGAVGAYFISRLSGKLGNLRTLLIVVAFWIPLCVFAYSIGEGEHFKFYILASCVGVVMGGVQSLARSTYSKFLPETKDHASYFSFYDVAEKIGIVLGTFFFGFMEFLMDDIRASILSIILFFVLGLILLFRVPKEETGKLSTKEI